MIAREGRSGRLMSIRIMDHGDGFRRRSQEIVNLTVESQRIVSVDSFLF